MDRATLSPNSVTVLKHLNALPDKTIYHNSRTLFESLGFERNKHSGIINDLWYRHPKPFIEKDNSTGAFIAQIRISPSGMDYINERFPDMSTLKESCESLFQEHKKAP